MQPCAGIDQKSAKSDGPNRKISGFCYAQGQDRGAQVCRGLGKKGQELEVLVEENQMVTFRDETAMFDELIRAVGQEPAALIKAEAAVSCSKRNSSDSSCRGNRFNPSRVRGFLHHQHSTQPDRHPQPHRLFYRLLALFICTISITTVFNSCWSVSTGLWDERALRRARAAATAAARAY